jgi:hypothetical protein
MFKTREPARITAATAAYDDAERPEPAAQTCAARHRHRRGD